jgi:4-amino-4-deoxy-L-arabinose transferase-like glycosyltransferase
MTVWHRLLIIKNPFLIALFAAVTFLTGVISPPHLMDDVDGTQSGIAKTMLQSGDWVTARVDGIPSLEKAPLKYWIAAICYRFFGISDWVGRLPYAFAAILLSLLVYYIGSWAGSEEAGLYGGLAIGTSIGLFLFTRTVIPDVLLTLAVAVTVWSFVRILEQDYANTLPWAAFFYISIGSAVLLKGLIGIVFPIGICVTYAAVTKYLDKRETWMKLRVTRGLTLLLSITIPWHLLAIFRNPPYFDLTLHAEPNFGHRFRGFFWFYFINDQFLRLTSGRWPRDYNTVPRVWFWLYHFLWFFPWSFFLVALRREDFTSTSRLGRLHILCLIWIGVVMCFFTLSTTQEYYLMPIYLALALLIGFAAASGRSLIRPAAKTAVVITAVAGVGCLGLLLKTRNLSISGDISGALTKKASEDYTLALAHTADLTFSAFAYLRTPLALAVLAFNVGSIALWNSRTARRVWGTALMLAIFFKLRGSLSLLSIPTCLRLPLGTH